MSNRASNRHNGQNAYIAFKTIGVFHGFAAMKNRSVSVKNISFQCGYQQMYNKLIYRREIFERKTQSAPYSALVYIVVLLFLAQNQRYFYSQVGRDLGGDNPVKGDGFLADIIYPVLGKSIALRYRTPYKEYFYEFHYWRRCFYSGVRFRLWD